MTAFNNISFGRENLAPFAYKADESRGRLIFEKASPTRTPFQRDRDRIIHSTAFRRLKHKTQVFVHHVGDHYRTRLTHSIEVAQIARSLARALRVDEDLAECLALSHDFGHTPFGHAGEEVLDLAMQEYGGFDHNAQSLKIVTELERQYAEFDGLNLSWETLEGLVKHNGPVTGDDIPGSITSFNEKFDLELGSFAGIEAQCAAIADDIAYNSHDIDDGLRAGLIELDDLFDLPITGEHLIKTNEKYPDLEKRRIRHELVRNQITSMVEDVIATTNENLETIKPKNATEVRHCGQTIVRFSDEMQAAERSIKSFLFERVYRSESVNKMRDGAEKIITDLFNAYCADISLLPSNISQQMPEYSKGSQLRRIADFIASMTDDFAINQHRTLFDETPKLR